jgi:L-lactate dehydrogenase complex protein LldF
VGGHAYGAVYPGPIGKLVTSQTNGLGIAGDLTTACTLCGACGEVCPVKIPIPDLIKRLRLEAVQGHVVKQAGSKRKMTEALIWKAWSIINSTPVVYRVMTWVITRMRMLIPAKTGKWTVSRSMPSVASRSLHEQVKSILLQRRKKS